MDTCCKKKDSVVIFGKVEKSHTCCCTAPPHEDGEKCYCNLTGQVTYLNGNIFNKIIDHLGHKVDKNIGTWNSIRTIINDQKDSYIMAVRDIWRFNLKDAVFATTELVVDKKTGKSVFLDGSTYTGTGKYLDKMGSYKLSLVDNSTVKAEIKFR
jgi:hypothetical protein